MKNSITNKNIARKVLPVFFILLIWQLAAMKTGKTYILPSPDDTLKALIVIFTTPRMLADIGFTLARMAISFTASFIVGTLLSAASYKGQVMESLISPVMTIIKSVPTMGVILLSLIWFKAEGTVLFVCSLIIVPLIYSNLLYGMKSFDMKLLEMGRQFGFTLKKNIRYIYWPSLKPFVN